MLHIACSCDGNQSIEDFGIPNLVDERKCLVSVIHSRKVVPGWSVRIHIVNFFMVQYLCLDECDCGDSVFFCSKELAVRHAEPVIIGFAVALSDDQNRELTLTYGAIT